jgi:hypothetical protein
MPAIPTRMVHPSAPRGETDDAGCTHPSRTTNRITGGPKHVLASCRKPLLARLGAHLLQLVTYKQQGCEHAPRLVGSGTQLLGLCDGIDNGSQP